MYDYVDSGGIGDNITRCDAYPEGNKTASCPCSTCAATCPVTPLVVNSTPPYSVLYGLDGVMLGIVYGAVGAASIIVIVYKRYTRSKAKRAADRARAGTAVNNTGTASMRAHHEGQLHNGLNYRTNAVE